MSLIDSIDCAQSLDHNRNCFPLFTHSEYPNSAYQNTFDGWSMHKNAPTTTKNIQNPPIHGIKHYFWMARKKLLYFIRRLSIRIYTYFGQNLSRSLWSSAISKRVPKKNKKLWLKNCGWQCLSFTNIKTSSCTNIKVFSQLSSLAQCWLTNKKLLKKALYTVRRYQQSTWIEKRLSIIASF